MPIIEMLETTAAPERKARPKTRWKNATPKVDANSNARRPTRCQRVRSAEHAVLAYTLKSYIDKQNSRKSLPEKLCERKRATVIIDVSTHHENVLSTIIS
jgi:hypothetical protein